MHKWLGKLITPAAFAVSFTGQLTTKDIQNYPAYNSLPNVEKGKFLLNSIAGRVTSFNPYPQYGTPKFTINPTGPINKYTGMGISLMVLGHVLPKGLGGKGIARKAGKGLFWGGVIGGFFDPATGARGGASQRGTTASGAIGGAKAYQGSNSY